MRPQYPVRASLEFYEPYILDQFCLSSGARIRRQDTICVAMQDQGGHGVMRNVLAEILDPCIDAGQCSYRRRAGCDIPVILKHPIAHELSACHIVIVEITQELHEEGGSVGLDSGADVIEDARVYAFWIVRSLHQIRTESSDERRLAHARGAVFADVSCDF